MDVGYFWSLPRGVSSRLEWGHARALSSRAVAAVSRFHLRGSRDLWLSLETFPRGFPTDLSHVPPWCESILGLKVEAVQGKQVSLEWTETSRGLWDWWHDPGFPLAFPVLTSILGYFWSLPRGVSPRLEWGNARALSYRAVAVESRFHLRGSRDLWLSIEAFPRSFPTALSHVPPWCESNLG